jgi:hypothetical protein
MEPDADVNAAQHGFQGKPSIRDDWLLKSHLLTTFLSTASLTFDKDKPRPARPGLWHRAQRNRLGANLAETST